MPACAPADPLRASPAGALLARAESAASQAGVTRLAELTRLDRLGLPVWQAVRPMGRALSVHQGKGATDADARLGALLEAIESHHAERFAAEGPLSCFDDLPAGQRPPRLSDLAVDREQPPPPDRAYRWIEATNPLTGEPLFVPFDLVSLDLTHGLPSPFDRSSNGLGAGTSTGEALAVALHEAIERDAAGEWMAAGLLERIASGIALDSIPFGWFGDWRDRIAAAGAYLRCHRLLSITGSPAIACEIADPVQPGAPCRAAQGHGCHPIPEIALFKALAEAIQARATIIAGAREDALPSLYSLPRGVVAIGAALPLPPSMAGVAWDRVAPGPIGDDRLIEALASAGYPDIAVVPLGSPEGFHVVKAHVCGLGAWRRRRRAPVH